MASSEAAARLTEGHRLAQAQIGARTVQNLRAAFPLLDPTNLDATVERWLRVSVPIVRQQQAQSARLAAEYLRAFRAVELGVADAYAARLVVDEATEAIATSLTVTGPVTIKEQMKRMATLEHATRLAMARSAASGMRHALNGGRNTIITNVREDSRALGWARATSGNPCHFCAMLASRGPVYGEDTADFQAHDSCGCTAEPVYRRNAAWPPGSERYRDLWNEAKRLDGDTEINFRRLVEGR